MARKKAEPQGRGEVLLGRFLNFCEDVKAANVRTVHIALYAYLVNLCAQNGWEDKFQVNSGIAMKRARIGNRKTFYKALKDLVEWGWLAYLGRGKTLNRCYGLTEGVEPQDFNEKFVVREQHADIIPLDKTSPVKSESISDSDMERFNRVFDAWAVNVTKGNTMSDRIWKETAMKSTGIKDFPLAMSLFKEHIIKLSKVKEWVGKTIEDKKSYFIFAAKHFATDACKIVKIPTAKIEVRNGKAFAIQYGTAVPLPDNFPPQPSTDYYWDVARQTWRLG